MRATTRRSVLNFGSKWLRQEPVMVKRSKNIAESHVQAVSGRDNGEQQSGEKIMGGGEIRGDNLENRDERENFQNSNVTQYMRLDESTVVQFNKVVNSVEKIRNQMRNY